MTMIQQASYLRQNPNLADDDLRSFIEKETSSHQVVIFSKTYCPYCKRTKQLFAAMDDATDVVVHELDTMTNGYEIQDKLYKMTGQRTVPSVWVNGQFIGGNDDSQAAFVSGRLHQLLSGQKS